MLEATHKQPLVAVVGPSGSGKSSVVFAGLVPQLRETGSWQIEVFRPGKEPFYQLASALVRQLEPELSETAQLREAAGLAADMHQGKVTLLQIVSRLKERNLGNTVRLWKKDGTLIGTFSKHRDRVTGVAWSPDGQTLASASRDKTVKLWNKDGALITTLTGHSDGVSGVAWSPDGQTLASASWDNTVRLYRKDGTLMTIFTEHSQDVWSITWSPDSQTLASASRDNTVKLWRKDGTLITTLTGYNDEVVGVAWSPDGQTLASASRDNTVKLQNLNLDDLLAQVCNWMHDYLKNISYESHIKLCHRNPK